MFSLLRTVLIIGAIFYYSPVRQSGNGALPFEGLFSWGTQKSDGKAAPVAASAAEPPARLETMWQALPDSAKQAVIDRILSTSGLGPSEAKPVPATDTLTTGDRLTSWRGGAKKPNP
ncbi:hypothetical protein [Microvirga sp. 2TAF3]|uniref:hypothetical protein n=1 Tax=Microvirga sp. 2TAF3 TaxID=3233014 RepID=UPI003F9494F4